MVQVNFATREVSVKIVYYGPGRSGKTTNLEQIHLKAPKDSKGELISIATETDRTLFFDFLPLDLGKIAGMTTKFQLYTVPGQVYYNATRKLVLQGADGVVFVADSSSKMNEENAESLENLAENLEENGLSIDDIPLVFQWNKRDLPDAMPAEEMNKSLNRWNAPACESVAVRGEGVFRTLKLLASLVIRKLNREHGFAEDGMTKLPAAGAPAAPAAPAQPAAAAPPKPVRLAGAGVAPARPAVPAAPAAHRPVGAPVARPPVAPAARQPTAPAAGRPAVQARQPVPAAPVGSAGRERAGGGTPPAAPAAAAAALNQVGRVNPLSLEIQRRKEALARQQAQRQAVAAARPDAAPQKKGGKGWLLALLFLLLAGAAGVAAYYHFFVKKLF